MERRGERDLEILTAIGEGRPLTQRDLAGQLGVALGLANLYLKRLARKGYVKITDFPRKPSARKRLRYLLTPKGIAEKSRLTYQHLAYSLDLYRRARNTLRESMASLPEAGTKRVALFGTGEAAELAYLTLREFGLEPIGVFGRKPGGDFLGFPVRGLPELREADFDAVILATFEAPDPWVGELRALGLPVHKLFTLRRLAGETNGRPRSR
jgi:DNA-binding MarR family transcriptional regulator